MWLVPNLGPSRGFFWVKPNLQQQRLQMKWNWGHIGPVLFSNRIGQGGVNKSQDPNWFWFTVLNDFILTWTYPPLYITSNYIWEMHIIFTQKVSTSNFLEIKSLNLYYIQENTDMIINHFVNSSLSFGLITKFGYTTLSWIHHFQLYINFTLIILFSTFLIIFICILITTS